MIALEEGGVIAGRYRLERELARGGMGAVWVAKHMQLDVAVAVKFMDPVYAASAEARSRFEREAKAAAKLQSPHVVHVLDYGVENGMPFIAMELLQGEDLGARLDRQGTLPIGAAAVVVTQVAKALRRAHDASIVHRDLKPGNIFIARHEDEEIVKVLDFGIAKASDAGKVGESTKTGTLIGSPHYMSPEQARGSKQLDWRSDIWSLGVIVFRMLTGRLPFPGDEIGEVIMAICADPIPVASELAPHLGPDVDAFFDRAMAREVSRRFQSVRELAEALTALARDAEGATPNARWSIPDGVIGDTTGQRRAYVTPRITNPNEVTRSEAEIAGAVETVKPGARRPAVTPSGTLASAQAPGQVASDRPVPNVAVVSAPARIPAAVTVAALSQESPSVEIPSAARPSVEIPSTASPSTASPSVEIPISIAPLASAKAPVRAAAPPSAVARIPAAVPPSAPVPSGTLAPIGNSFAELPKRGPSPMMLAAMALGFALVVGGYLLLRSPRPAAPSAVIQATNALAESAPAASAPAAMATIVASAATASSSAALDPPAATSANEPPAAPRSTTGKVPVPRPAVTGTPPAGKPKSSVLGF